MKTSLSVVLFLSTAGNLVAQTNAAAPAQTNVATQATNIAYAIVSRDANSRMWQATNWTQDASGQWVPHVHKITELSIGVCHLAGSNYVDSSEAIALLPDGTAAATNCATQVYFPADIGSGVIRLVTSDGKVLQNGPAYLAFDDGTNAIMIAAVTNSVGQLISSNQVLYPDIFHGAGFRADLLCTVRKSGFESDVVFREQIPQPASVGMGTNAQVEFLTEWFDTPEPTQTTNAPNQADGLTQVTLHFGTASIGRGRAFITGTNNAVAGSVKSLAENLPVYKRWLHGNSGQAFLAEMVPYGRLAPQLQQLPAPNAVAAAAKPEWQKLFSIQKLPSRPRYRASSKGIQLAKADSHRALGVVLDYVELSGTYGDYTFLSGTTYFVSGYVDVSGNATIQDSAIFKYPNDGGCIEIDGNLTCPDVSAPAIFTAVDDDSVGDSMSGIGGYTGTVSGYYGDPDYGYVFLPETGEANTTLQSLQFFYAGIGAGDDFEDGYIHYLIQNCQFLNCQIDLDGMAPNVLLKNDLFAGSECLDSSGGDPNIQGNNVTIDGCTYLFNDVAVNGGRIEFTNSIVNVSEFATVEMGADDGIERQWPSTRPITSLQNTAVLDGEVNANIVYSNNVWSADPDYTGNYYLAANSPYIDAGNTTADRVGLYEYTTQTTPGSMEGISVVDLGYHHLAVDAQGNPVSTLVAGVPDYVSDSNGNGLPDAWESNYFGNFNHFATDLDSQGNTLLYDYTNGLDPNVIFFTLFVTNSYVNHTNTTVQVSLNGGTPAYYAVLVNDINEAHATWRPYTSSNLTAGLGPTNGVYQVWAGLKGVATNATQTWEETTLTLDTLPPTITVTNPTSSVVSQPMVQVQGLVSEKLSSLTFDVSNALSVLTNQTGYTGGAIFDTNVLNFTTNSFQLYDVFLTNGLNTITIHATDRAGNTGTTNFNVTLDYSSATNPPVLDLLWPQDGAQVTGDSSMNFTIEVLVDDLTAQVAASANGQTVEGQIQRNGQVRGLTLPLAAGTNTIIITATNAAGLVSTTNVNVVQSSVNLSICPLTTGQLNQSSVSVTGTVSDVTQIITVNGVRATVSGGPAWVATNVPVSAVGMATFTINAYPAGSDPASAAPDAQLHAYQLQPPLVRIQSLENADNYSINGDTFGDAFYWTAGTGGASMNFEDGSLTDYTPLSPDYYSGDTMQWFNQNWSDEHGVYDGDDEVDSFYHNVQLVADTGGEGMPGTTQTYANYTVISGYANGAFVLSMPPEDFSIQEEQLTDLGTNESGETVGAALGTSPAGTLPDVMPVANSTSVSQVPTSFGAANDASGQYYSPQSLAVSSPLKIVDLNTSNVVSNPGQINTVVVGQQMNLACQPTITNSSIQNFQWTVPGYGTYAISNYIVAPAPNFSSAMVVTNFPLNNSNVVFYWVKRGNNLTVKCSGTVNGKSATAQATFNVIAPDVSLTLTPKSNVVVETIPCEFNATKLTLGNVCNYTNNVGMYFAFAVNNLNGCTNPFTLQLVQLISVDYFENDTNISDIIPVQAESYHTGYVLDTTNPAYACPYVNGLPTAGTFYDDSPDFILSGLPLVAVSVAEHFEDCLMFQPTNGIPVPLKVGTWNWSGCAYLIPGTSPPSYALGDNPTNAQPGIGIDTSQYPSWTNNIQTIFGNSSYKTYQTNYWFPLCP